MISNYKESKIREKKEKVKAYMYVGRAGRLTVYFYTDKAMYNYFGKLVSDKKGSFSNYWTRTDFYIEVEE